MSIAVGVLGVAFTIFALIRTMAAIRRGAPRELVLGWMALMIAGAAVAFLTQRVL